MTTTEVFLVLCGLRSEAESLMNSTRGMSPAKLCRRADYERFKKHVSTLRKGFTPSRVKHRSAVEKRWMREVLSSLEANMTMTNGPFLMFDSLNRTCTAIDRHMKTNGNH